MSSSVRPHSSLSHVRNSFREQGRGNHQDGREGLLCGAEWTSTLKLNGLPGEQAGAGAISTWGLGLRMALLGKNRIPTFSGCTASDSQEGSEVTGTELLPWVAVSWPGCAHSGRQLHPAQPGDLRHLEELGHQPSPASGPPPVAANEEQRGTSSDRRVDSPFPRHLLRPFNIYLERRGLHKHSMSEMCETQ